MRVLFDIDHPAHVHFFKYTIWGLKKKGHHTAIIAREKDVTLKLLDLYGFEYQIIGFSGAKNRFRQFQELVLRDIAILRLALKFKPDVILTRNPPGFRWRERSALSAFSIRMIAVPPASILGRLCHLPI